MSTHKALDKICYAVLAATLFLTVFFINAANGGIQRASTVMGYENKLFSSSTIHNIDIVMDDWEDFIADCKSKEYYNCTIVIDNEVYQNVAIRGKGNTSLTKVEAYGNNRYSFKIEFDHYDSARTYHGLDKLCLNNIIQDNTYMKDYLTYQMMAKIGAASPLCSYAYITVNGKDWGLYLAVEGVEESFLQRCYGNAYGNLYKPDSMGGGLGNRGKMPMERLDEEKSFVPDFKGKPGNINSSNDVLLRYIDDNMGSYPNIFHHAKTDITDADKARLIQALKKLSNHEEIDDVVDTEAVIRYFVVHNFVLNFDSYTGSMIHNYYLYEQDGQLQMIPWDYNLAFGGFQFMGDASDAVNYPIDSPVSEGNVEDRPMLAWIFENEEYTQLYHQYFKEFITGYFDSGSFVKQMDSTISMISPYVKKDPTKFCTYEEFETGVATLQKFCLLRAESISCQLEGTIGSTKDTQDSATWIDATNIQISAMGSMGGHGMDKPGSSRKQQQNNTDDKNVHQPPTGNRLDSSEKERMPHRKMDTNAPKENFDKQPQPSWLIACIIILSLGIGFAWFYKR